MQLRTAPENTSTRNPVRYSKLPANAPVVTLDGIVCTGTGYEVSGRFELSRGTSGFGERIYAREVYLSTWEDYRMDRAALLARALRDELQDLNMDDAGALMQRLYKTRFEDLPAT